MESECAPTVEEQAMMPITAILDQAEVEEEEDSSTSSPDYVTTVVSQVI